MPASMPAPRRDRLIGKIPLHWVLVVPFVLLTTGTVSLVGYLSYRSGQKSVEDMAYQLLNQTSQRVSDRLTIHLQMQQQTVAAHRLAVQQGTLDLQNLPQVNQRLWQTVNLSPLISGNIFNTPQGTQVGYTRLQSQELVDLASRLSGVPLTRGMVLSQRIENSTTRKQVFAPVDEQGKPQQPIYSLTNDIRSTIWFQMAQATPAQRWSPIFVYRIAPTLGMLAIAPVHDQNRNFQGVFVAGLTLSEISTFLHDLNFSPSGQALIMERSGHLVATSTLETPFIFVSKNNAQRLLAIQSQNAETRAIAQHLLQKIKDPTKLKTSTRLSVKHGDRRQFIQVTPYQDQYGLDWLIVTVVPEADFIGEIQKNLWQTLLLSGLTLLGTTATGILMALWIAKPIQQLSRASRTLAAGNWQQSLEEDSCIAEFSALAQSFNQTAAQLQQSFDRIKTALAESEEKFTTIFRASPDPIAIALFWEERFLEVNPQATEFCGYIQAEMIGHTAVELGLWDSLEERDHWVEQLHRDRKVDNFEATIRTKSSQLKTALVSAEVHDLNGQSCIIMIWRDISDRKQTEIALRASESRFQRVTAAIPSEIYILVQGTDGAYRFEYMSPACRGIQELEPEQVMANPDLSFDQVHPDDRAGMYAIAAQSAQTLEPFTHEWRIITPSGQLKWVAGASRPERRSNGEIVWYGVVQDITGRKQTELALKQSELRFREISDSSPANIYILVQRVDGSVYFEHMSRAIEVIHELPVEEVLANANVLIDRIHPADRAGYDAAVQHSLETMQPFQYEWRVINPSGQLKWLQGNSRPLRRDNGEVAWHGVVIDISDRKRAEIALKQALQELTYHVEHSPLATIRWNREFRVESWSHQAELIFGWRAEEVLGKTMYDWQFIFEDDLAVVNQTAAHLLQGEASLCLNRNYHQNGSVVYCEWYNSVLLDETGELISILSLAQDVTQRLQTETALRDSEARFQQLGAASPGVIYTVVESLAGPVRFEYVSAAFEEIHELPVAAVLRDASLVANQMHPADRADYQQAIAHSLETMQPFQHEWRIVTASGKVKWIQANSRPERLPNGDILWHGIVLDVSDRKQAEIALQRNEEQMRLLADALPVFISYADTEQRYQFVNKTYELHFGLSREAIQGQYTRDLIGEANYTLNRPQIERVLAGESVNYEVTMPQLDQPDRCVSVVLVPDFDEVNQVRGYYSLMIDISDRKAAEQSLRRYERIVSATADAIALIDRNYRYQIVNQTFLNWHGKFYSEIIGHSIPELLGQEVFTTIIQPRLDRCLAGEPIQYSQWFELAGIGRQFLSVTYAPYVDADQSISGVVASVRNITAIKQTEEALRQSEERFREIASTISQLFFVRSITTGEFLYISPAYEKIWGQPCASLYQNPDHWKSFVHPDDREVVVESLKQQFEGHPVRREYRIIRPDGIVRWISAEVLIVRDETGHPQRLVGTAEDITERRQAEQRVQAEIDFRRAIEDAIVEGIAVTDMNGRQIYVNPGFCDMLGWSEAELLGQTPPYPYWPLEETDRIMQAFANCLDGNRPPQGLELRFMRRNGERFDVLILDAPLRDSNGNITAWLASVYDITDRKQAERQLQQAIQDVNTHFQESPLAIVQWDKNYRILRWSKQAEHLFGWMADEVNTRDWKEFQFIYEEDQELVNLRLAPLLRGEITSQTILNRNYTKDERVLLCQWYSSAVFDESGELVSVLSFAEDVTDRYRMETALRRSEQKFRGAFDTISSGMALVSPAGEFLEVNAALCEMLGYAESELLQLKLEQIDHPDDQPLDLALVERFFAEQPSAYQVEKRFLSKAGQTVWGLMNLAITRDVDGNPLYLIVQMTNISDRKHAEEALASSEARLRAILTAIPDSIFLYSTEGIYLDAMQTGGLLDLIEDLDPVGKHIHDLVPHDVASRQQHAVHQVLATGAPQIYEQEVWVRGKLQYEEVRIVACGENAVLVIIRDIGDRKLREIERQVAEEALRESEERFRRAFDDAAIGMAWVSTNGRFLKVSQSLCEIVGYNEEELLARHFHNITHPDDLPVDLELTERMLAGEQRAYQREKRYIHQQGHIIWVLVNVSLVRDRNGNPLYFVSQIQDISDRHELDRIKDEFISIVSHELRTPLTAIRGSLGILETGVLDQDPDTAKQMLQVALNNSDRLVRLVNDILDLERLESGKVKLALEDCLVIDLLQQALESVQAIALQAAVTIHVTSDDARISVAPDSIVQALTNLLGNAIKFSPPGSTVWLKAEMLEALSPIPHPAILFSIQDQGRGIPPEKLESIFGRFQQVDVSDSRQKGGTGLGLAICKSIVQQHGGKIWAESQIGAGSTFYFIVPCAGRTHDEARVAD
ncbi:MAG: PAS domain S-box protein [Leptolyngbyaceae cyanobacterium bins.349]|nr:PAS domain S-box protein [Leptolyngbyaceae cyanobacterium bins.349]